MIVFLVVNWSRYSYFALNQSAKSLATTWRFLIINPKASSSFVFEAFITICYSRSFIMTHNYSPMYLLLCAFWWLRFVVAIEAIGPFCTMDVSVFVPILVSALKKQRQWCTRSRAWDKWFKFNDSNRWFAPQLRKVSALSCLCCSLLFFGRRRVAAL